MPETKFPESRREGALLARRKLATPIGPLKLIIATEALAAAVRQAINATELRSVLVNVGLTAF